MKINIKKFGIIAGVIVVLVVAIPITKYIYNKIYDKAVKSAVENLGFDSKQYNLEGKSPAEIREEITRKETLKKLAELGIDPNSLDLSKIDFARLSKDEIYKISLMPYYLPQW